MSNSGQKLLLLVGAIALVVAGTAVYYDWPRIAFHVVAGHKAGASRNRAELGLRDYRAEIQGRPIAGIDSNASGLTWSFSTGTLFMVVNHPPAAAELDTDGRVLRHISLPPALKDAEGISHVRGNLFVIADEADNRLHWVMMAPGEAAAVAVAETRLDAGFHHRRNSGFEGIEWDPVRNQLWLVNEKRPRRVLRIDGLDTERLHAKTAAPVQTWQPLSWLGTLGRDLASVAVVASTGHLLLLSEASGLLMEYSRQGELLGTLALWRGSGGLKETVPQPEGLALSPEGTIYMVSEPNLFYRFSKKMPENSSGHT